MLWVVFERVEVGFFLVGCTDEDVNQAFSKTPTRLRSEHAATLDDLYGVLRKTFLKSLM